MMKYLLMVGLFCLCFTNMIYSSECDEGEYRREPGWDSGRKYICYEFGFSNIIKIYIADGDTICNVLILDGKDNCVSTTCTKSPILKWAFDDVTIETTKPSVELDNNYKPYYYQLSIFYGSCQTILSASTLLIDYSNGVKKKIEDLKAFIIRLWYSNCIKENSSNQLNGTGTKCFVKMMDIFISRQRFLSCMFPENNKEGPGIGYGFFAERGVGQRYLHRYPKMPFLLRSEGFLNL